MQIDPATEFRRLADEYRAKADDELLELAADFADLTEPAQQALRQEMQSRRIDNPETTKSLRPRPPSADPQQAPLALRNAQCDGGTTADIEYGPFVASGARAPELEPETPDAHDKDDGPNEYTWKTLLCECETTEQAQQLVEALQQAGIESWVEHPGATYRYRGSALEYPRVLVAADQLEQAKAIAAKPIPQEIIDHLKEEIPEFIEPKCPTCGSDDVVLEGVDSENHWRCEQCDAVWSDPAEVEEPKGEKAADLPS